MEEAAAIARQVSGADFIDINMGCPVPKVANSGDGSGLMRTPDKAVRVAEAVIRGAGCPVTVSYTHLDVYKRQLQGIDTRIPDVPGCHKVGFPDAQGNGVLHLLQNIKKLPNARGLDALDLLIQDRLIIHTKIYSLSWGS